MPAYTQFQVAELADVVCPHCIGLTMYVVDVEPHWNIATLDFTYECSSCGTNVKTNVTKPEHRR